MESNYSSLITPPKFSETNVKQNIYDVGEYRKILKGENSRRLPATSLPLGRIYSVDTGVMCDDIKTGQPAPRHSIIDAKKSKGKGLLDSASADFESAATNDIFEDTTKKFSNKCMSVNVNEVDKQGKKTVGANKFLSLAEIRRTSPDLLVGNPTVPPEFKEPFISPGLVDEDANKVTVANFMKHMDNGQRFFIGTVAIMGLYMYHQLLFGNKR